MNTLSIIGAGGHTRSSVNLIKEEYGDTHKLLIYDDTYDINSEEVISNIKLIGKIEDIQSDSLVFLSIGDNDLRAEYFNKFQEQLIQKNLFHKSVITQEYFTAGVSNQIFALAYINSHVKIGDDNIINTASILEHEVEIGDHNHISVGVRVCGRSKIEDYCFIGAGAIIIDKVSICSHVVIGAGSVVIADIVEPGTYVGNPARRVR